jgi:hypothetical protein
MASICSYCETLDNVVKKQEEAEENVTNNSISEGRYLQITAKLYKNLLELCECKKKDEREKEEDDDGEEIDVVEIDVTINNTERRLFEILGELNYNTLDVSLEEFTVLGTNKKVKKVYTPSEEEFNVVFFDCSDSKFKIMENIFLI